MKTQPHLLAAPPVRPILLQKIHAFRPQKGFSLIELLVSIALGASVLAAIGLVYQNLTGGNRTAQALQQMNLDAQLGFQILGQQLRQAGYNPLQPRTATPEKNTLTLKGTATAPALPASAVSMGVFGCDTGFANARAASGTAAATDISDLTCNTTATPGGGAIAIQFEGDSFIASVVASGASAIAPLIPADCRGFKIDQQITQPLSAGSDKYYVVENRYFIANGGLSCTGNGGDATNQFANPSQPLVPNVQSMKLDYVLQRDAAAGPPAVAALGGYLTAAEIGPALGAGGTPATAISTLQPSSRWALVNTVRVCLLMASAQPVYSEPMAITSSGNVYSYYYDCNGTLTASSDLRMRRAYTTHLALRNRVGLP